jgi:hypothetical protein
MNKGYEIQVSRAPDGQIIFTRDAEVPLQHECLVLDGENGERPADAVFIHLQILHDGSRYPVWVCESPDVLNDPNLVSRFTIDRKDEIIAAFKQWQGRRGNG